tara:strand:+ start:445 stop:1386 length:942 start_codon:yes stop_codon:yes gene_type:complete
MDKFFKIKGTNKITSRIGIGGAPSGGYGWGERNDAAAIEGLLTGLENEIYLYDTADCYGLGNAEKILGHAIKESKVNRDLLTISTKGGVAWDEQSRIYKDSSPSYIEKAVDRSLERLGLDYIDIYYLHWTDGKTPIEETFEKLIEIKKVGKIKSLGVSNLSISEIEKINNFELSALQIKGNLLEPSEIYEFKPLANKINASLITFSTLADGILTGKFDESTKFDKEDHRNKYPLFRKDIYKLCLEKVKLIKNLSSEYNATISQIAIRWVLETEGVDAILFGSISKKNILNNINAFNIDFDEYLYETLIEKITL